jgi:hypothetical protein
MRIFDDGIVTLLPLQREIPVHTTNGITQKRCRHISAILSLDARVRYGYLIATFNSIDFVKSIAFNHVFL